MFKKLTITNLKNGNPIVLMRYLLVFLISLSFTLTIYANFLDLFNPGSEVAREYVNLVYFLLFLSLFLIIPLLHEKFHDFEFEIEKYQKLEKNAKKQQILGLIKAHFHDFLYFFIIFLSFVIIFSIFFESNIEIIQNYQNFYTYNGVLK